MAKQERSSHQKLLNYTKLVVRARALSDMIAEDEKFLATIRSAELADYVISRLEQRQKSLECVREQLRRAAA